MPGRICPNKTATALPDLPLDTDSTQQQKEMKFWKLPCTTGIGLKLLVQQVQSEGWQTALHTNGLQILHQAGE